MSRSNCWLAALLLAFVAPTLRAADPSPVVQGNNRFAFDLYAKLRTQEGNLFLSPFSISTALAMTSAGAKGQTWKEMAATLHFPDQDTLHPTLGKLLTDLNSPARKKNYQLAVANALWLQKGYPFLPSFQNLNKQYYHAKLEELDFKSQPEASRQTINQWVEKQTQEKIKDLMPKGSISPLTRLVLTNAIYFKGNWASQFKKDRTSDQDFFVTADNKVKVPLMSQTSRFGYLANREVQVLEMPYAGDELSMVVLLPAKRNGLTALEATLNADKLAGWLKELVRREVQVYLPRFQTTSSFQLNRVLADMGMPQAFTPKADFSGIDGGKGDLHISDVIHKAFVEVNEKGTEAAAATGIGIRVTSAPAAPPVFRADHPFVFLIRDKKSGTLLFLGRLSNPGK